MLTTYARMCLHAQETKVKKQQSACDDIQEWLQDRHNWQSLLGKRVPSFALSPLPCPRVRGGELTRQRNAQMITPSFEESSFEESTQQTSCSQSAWTFSSSAKTHGQWLSSSSR